MSKEAYSWEAGSCRDLADPIARVECVIRKVTEGRIKRLYPCQREALAKILEEYSKMCKVRGIVQMPTGTGKTLVGVAAMLLLPLASRMYCSNQDAFKRILALFITPRRAIQAQVHALLSKEMHLRCTRTGSYIAFSLTFKRCRDRLYRGTYTEMFCNAVKDFLIRTVSRSGDLDKVSIRKGKANPSEAYRELEVEAMFVGVISSQLLATYISKKEKCLDTILENANVLIFDEAHAFYKGLNVSNIVSRIVREAKAPIILGLTATPVKESKRLFGDVIYMLPSREAMERRTLTPALRKIQYFTIITNITRTDGTSVDERDAWIHAIRERARRYAEVIVRELDSIAMKELNGRMPKTLVVAANALEADILREELRALLKGKDVWIQTAHYMKGLAHKTINAFRSFGLRKQAILITVDMADIGFDDPNLEVLVLARPVRSPVAYVQLRGRILRRPTEEGSLKLKDNDGYAVILDLVGEPGVHRLERLVELVELGVFSSIEFERAEEELRGYLGEKVKEANANVVLIKVEEEDYQESLPKLLKKCFEKARYKGSCRIICKGCPGGFEVINVIVEWEGGPGKEFYRINEVKPISKPIFSLLENPARTAESVYSRLIDDIAERYPRIQWLADCRLT